MKNAIEMLKRLAGTGNVEINNLKHTLKFKDAYGKENMYFCCGMDKNLYTRCKDSDFTKKSYFVVDIDLRENYYTKNQEVLSQDQLEKDMNNIIDFLKENELGDFSYVVMSGNGMHIYYCGDEIYIEAKTYSCGVSYVYGLIDDIIGSMGYHCDQACSNISRITRLPGSINPRKKVKQGETLRDLGDIECKLVHDEYKISKTFNKLEEYCSDGMDTEEVKTFIKKETQKRDNTIYDTINDIPCLQIACDLYNVEHGGKKDGVIVLKEEHKNMGAYYYEPKNLIINTGSSLIRNRSEKFFTTRRLVKDEMFGGDAKQAIEYFERVHGVEVKTKGVIPDKVEYDKIGYTYPGKCFDKMGCLMSGELCVLVARSNSGKTTFAMNMLLNNNAINKRGFYINLEFEIKTVAQERWLSMNGKHKRNLTDIDPLSVDEKFKMDKYVDDYISKFDFYNEPKGLELDDLIDLIIEKNKEGFGLFVVDSLSRIQGTLEGDKARTVQNKVMERMQELCQNTGVCVIMLHHTNKKGEHEGSQKILDLANVFIFMERDNDPHGASMTTFTLSKDKFVQFTEINTSRENGRYSDRDEMIAEKHIDYELGDSAELDDVF